MEFHSDNPFFKMVGKMLDCAWASLLWFVCSIPIFTIGASTTALYYTANKCLRNDRGYVASEFFAAFRSNFKQSTIVWLIILVIYAVSVIDFFIMKLFAAAGEAIGSLSVVFVVFVLFVMMWSFYVFPYIARFANTTKNVCRITIYMALSNFPWTMALTVLFLGMCLVLYTAPLTALLMPAVYQLLKNLVLEQIFKKFMAPEDLAAKEECREP